jgi:hypothetical protein
VLNLVEKKREAILQWISLHNFQTKHTILREKYVPNTGSWLFEDPELKNWLQTDIGSVILCRGIGALFLKVLTDLIRGFRKVHVSVCSSRSPGY